MLGSLVLGGRRWCCMCGEYDATIACCTCDYTFYCSQDCLRFHWLTHRLHCNTTAPIPKEVSLDSGYLVFPNIPNSPLSLDFVHYKLKPLQSEVTFHTTTYEHNESIYYTISFPIEHTDLVLSYLFQQGYHLPSNNGYISPLIVDDCAHCPIHYYYFNRLDTQLFMDNLSYQDSLDFQYRSYRLGIIYFTDLTFNRLEDSLKIYIPAEIRDRIRYYCTEWMFARSNRIMLFPIGGLENIWIFSQRYHT